jgi:copper(I)-binding protein
MATMHPVEDVPIGPGEALAFAPGGKHAMLFGIDPAVQPGQRLPLAFRFASGRTIAAEAEVRQTTE